MKKHILLFLTTIISFSGIAQTVLLQENFTTYLGTSATVPIGWNFSYNGNYTSASLSGTSGPNSYKFGIDATTISTPSFSNADTVSFWIKGSGTDSLSSLTVEQSSDNINWNTITVIVPLPTTGTNKKLHLSGSSTNLRFNYFKSAGNLAFDDFSVIRTSAVSTGKIKIYFNRPVNTSISAGVNAIYLNNNIDDTLIAYINRAKYSLDFAVYNYVQTSGISNIAAAVNAAFARGVNIRWIYDGGSTNSGVTALNAGINRLGSPTTSAYNIMHNKFMIVDANSTDINDPIVWTGSCNWNTQQMNSDVNNVIILQDKNLALAYTTEFNEMWGSNGLTPNTVNSKFGSHKTNNTPHSFTIGGITVEQYFSPSDATNSHIVSTINTANTDLYFGVFTFTDVSDANAIATKIQSGVYATGIMDQNSLNFAAYPILNPVMNTNLKIYSQGTLYHNKLLIVDPCTASSDPLVLTGSHNWSGLADTKNDENTLIIHDAAIANIYFQSFTQNFIDLGGTFAAPCFTTSVDENSTINDAITVYPNPGSGEFHFSGLEKGNCIEIFDMMGKLIFQSTQNYNQLINLEEQKKGIYLYRITDKTKLIQQGKICIE